MTDIEALKQECIKAVGDDFYTPSVVNAVIDHLAATNRLAIQDTDRAEALGGLNWLTKELDFQWKHCDLSELDCWQYERAVNAIRNALSTPQVPPEVIEHVVKELEEMKDWTRYTNPDHSIPPIVDRLITALSPYRKRNK